MTAIVPHEGNLFQDKVPAAVVVGNGFGKLMGSTQVQELGEIETPLHNLVSKPGGSLIAPLALAQQPPPLASIPPVIPPAGFRSADVEGQTIRYYCQGIGNPTVIIEQGGGISYQWR